MCITHICHNFNSVTTVYREKKLIVRDNEYWILNYKWDQTLRYDNKDNNKIKVDVLSLFSDQNVKQ
jgi:hypothetical protein